MKRENGYIDISSIVGLDKEKYQGECGFNALLIDIISSPSGVLVKQEDNKQLVFRFKYNDEVYYFKYDCIDDGYSELFFEEICKELDIPCISYDLACIGQFYGVISKDYKIPGAKYISGKALLKNNSNSKKIETIKDLWQMNTLDMIWDSLECRYQSREDKEQIVADLMNKIVKMFIVDLLLGSADRHLENWEIIEYQDGKVDLQPAFDNGRMLRTSPEYLKPCMQVETEEMEQLNPYLLNNVTKFCKRSSKEFVDILINSLWVLEEENVRKVIERIEEKTGCLMPGVTMVGLIKATNVYLEFFKDTLGIYEIPKEGR